MPWSAPTYTGGVVWQDLPSHLTPLNAADLNTEENAEATYSAAVGQSVVNYLAPLAATANSPLGDPVAIPPSGTAIASAPYDRTMYLTTSTSTCQMAIQNGPSPIVPVSSFGTIRVPAGKSVTPTYTVTPTSLLVEGE